MNALPKMMNTIFLSNCSIFEQYLFQFNKQSNHQSMKVITLLPIAIIILACVVSSQQPYKKVVNTIDPQARCLDGSSPAIYLHEGGDTKKILFYMMGGGDCGGTDLQTTLENCYQRSKTVYGSSIYWAQTRPWGGILSTNASLNPFATWTKVFMIYCDGAFHQGNTKEPFSYKDTDLYFRGGLNTRAHFQYIHNRFNLTNADNVILSGSSAGGISTFIWVDYLKSFVGNSRVKIHSIIDSGIFLDQSQIIQNFNVKQSKTDQQLIFKVANMDEGVPNRYCAENQPPSRQWNCLSAQGAIPYLGVESLFIESAYDQFVIRYGAGINCLKQGASGFSLENCNKDQMKIIEDYRDYYMKYLKTLTLLGHNIWSISCSWHAVLYLDQFYDSPLQRVPMQSGNSIQKAISKYVFDNDKVFNIDSNPWPSNKPCAY